MSELKTYFVAGTGTDVGKTICASILVEALQADYWKPIQAGGLDFTDTMRVKSLISNSESVFFEERYRLKQPMSPHAAAKADGIHIRLDDFQLPQTQNHLIIESAGGLMVPINDEGDLMLDLIDQLKVEVILVSQNYLGSINHTLLSIAALKMRNQKVAGILFNGPSNPETEEIILKISGLKCLGRIPLAEHVKQKFIRDEAEKFKTLVSF
ncbi:MAG: dethiobiotin synthase [Bacteroidetes bacterium]|nr:dethiobiotin synthase [Bacteroidota bacterium]